MFSNLKEILKKQLVLKSILFNILVCITVFFVVFLCFYGRSIVKEESLRLDYDLLVGSVLLQDKIQPCVFAIDEAATTEEQKQREIKDTILPIINEIKDYSVGYYVPAWGLMVKNESETKISFDEICAFTDIAALDFGQLKKDNGVVSTSVPIYGKETIESCLFILAEKPGYAGVLLWRLAPFVTLGAVLLAIVRMLIKKYILAGEEFLQTFYEGIARDEAFALEQELSQVPVYQAVLHKIADCAQSLKQNKIELEAAKLRIVEVMEGNSDGFFDLNQKWEFTFINKETCEFLGRDGADLIGKNIWKVFPQAVDSLTHEKLKTGMEQREAVHWDSEGFAMINEFYEFHAYPSNDGMSVSFRNVTELKQRHSEFARLEKLNLLGQLAAGLSHEVRNPLTTIKGFLQIFASRLEYQQDKGNLELMIAELDRVNTIIADFLALSKPSSDQVKRQELNGVVEKMYPLVQADAVCRNIEVILDLTQTPAILINEDSIKQLLLNLVRNALEVTPEAGRVTVHTYSDVDRVILAVEDQGSGIPLEIQKKIGTPFFTTKADGTGLGLAISMEIAQKHRAMFNFDTDSGGTTFYIAFPTCNLLASSTDPTCPARAQIASALEKETL